MGIFDQEWYLHLDDPKWRQEEWQRIIALTKRSIPNLDLNHLRVDNDWVHISEWWVIALNDSRIDNYRSANISTTMSVQQWQRVQEILAQFSSIWDARRAVARNVLALIPKSWYWLYDESYVWWYWRILSPMEDNPEITYPENLNARVREKAS